MELQGRVALITGASRGIGRGIAERLARAGMRLVLNYRSGHDAARESQRAVQALGAEAYSFATDVADQGGVERMVEEAVERYGQIDALVANAGIDTRRPPDAVTLGDWEDVLRVNLTGAYLCAKAVAGPMRRQGGGRIVMISSIAGLRGTGTAPYVASKAGMLGLSMALARTEAPHGITVNAVAPGVTRSEMLFASIPDIADRVASEVPLGRMGEPADVAEAVVFLLRSDYVTGTVINVSGGRHMGL